jgi:uncharacterized cupin superfamily protein
MMTLLKHEAVGEPDIEHPAADRIIAGDPEHRTWLVEERDGLFAGVWESTPGTWRVAYEEWEYFRILSGRSIVTGDDGTMLDLCPGDSAVIRPGFRGTWQVVETTRKDFVILV